jgi:hypothetical protein
MSRIMAAGAILACCAAFSGSITYSVRAKRFNTASALAGRASPGQAPRRSA